MDSEVRRGGAFIVALLVATALAGCVDRLGGEITSGSDNDVRIVPQDQWTWIGSRETSAAITSTLATAVDDGTLGCVSFERTGQAPREPMYIFHHLSSYGCRDQNKESWGLLLGYANGTDSADDVFAAQNGTLATLRSRALGSLAAGEAGNLVGYHVVARMQEMFSDAERNARSAAAEFDRARAAGSFTHSEVNATRLHGIVVQQLFAQHLLDTVSVAWDLIEEAITAGSRCGGAVGEGPSLPPRDAERILLKHRDAIIDQSSNDLEFALSGALYDLSEAVASLRFAHDAGWAPLELRAASEVILLDMALARIAPDPDFRLTAGHNVIDDGDRARMNATINEIVRSGVDPWSHGHVDRAIRLLMPQAPGLEVGLEPTLDALLALGGTAVRPPCAVA